jgi:hypothetical protein
MLVLLTPTSSSSSSSAAASPPQALQKPSAQNSSRPKKLQKNVEFSFLAFCICFLFMIQPLWCTSSSYNDDSKARGRRNSEFQKQSANGFFPSNFTSFSCTVAIANQTKKQKKQKKVVFAENNENENSQRKNRSNNKL